MAKLQNTNVNNSGFIKLGSYVSRPNSLPRRIIYSEQSNNLEIGKDNDWVRIGSIEKGSFRNPGENGLDIINNNSSAQNTNGFYWINTNNKLSKGPIQLYFDMTTDGGGWAHVATFNDSGSVALNSSPLDHPWAFFLGHLENGNLNRGNNNNGPWGDTSYIGSHTFADDYKNGDAWASLPFSQILMKDQGDNLRNLWYTDPGEIDTTYSTNLLTFFNNGGNGGDVWKETSSGRDRDSGSVNTLRTSVTNFGVSDDVFGAASSILWAFGEDDATNIGNSDRSMITRGDVSSNVSSTQGIGVSRADNNSDSWRDIDPTFRDEPGSISGTYNYTLWIR